MKRVMTGIGALMVLLATQSCTTKEAQYVDLNTGTPFELVKHPQTGLMVDAETGKPLNIYVDRATKDTIDGRSGKIINGQVEKVDNSFYVHTDLQQNAPILATGNMQDLQDGAGLIPTE